MSDDEESDYLVSEDEPPEEDEEFEIQEPKLSSNKEKGRKKHQWGEWIPDGKNAQLLAQKIVSGAVDPSNFKDAVSKIPEIKEWIDTNEFTRDNIRRRYNCLARGIHIYIITSNSSPGFSVGEAWIRSIGLEGRGATSADGLPGYTLSAKDTEKFMPTMASKKKAPTPKTKGAASTGTRRRSARVVGGNDGGTAAAAAPTPAPAPAPTPPRQAHVPSVADLTDQLQEIDIGEGLPVDEMRPRILMGAHDMQDPIFGPRSEARPAVFLMVILAPFMVWADVYAAMIEMGTVLLVRYTVNQDARDVDKLFPPDIRRHFSDFVGGVKRALRAQPQVREIRIPMPVQCETFFRYPNRQMPVAEANNHWNRWRSDVIVGSDGQSQSQVDMGLSMVFSLHEGNDDDLDRRKDKFRVNDMAGRASGPASPPDMRGYSSDSSVSPEKRRGSRSSRRRSRSQPNRKRKTKSSRSRRHRDEESHKRSGRPRAAGLKDPEDMSVEVPAQQHYKTPPKPPPPHQHQQWGTGGKPPPYPSVPSYPGGAPWFKPPGAPKDPPPAAAAAPAAAAPAPNPYSHFVPTQSSFGSFGSVPAPFAPASASPFFVPSPAAAPAPAPSPVRARVPTPAPPRSKSKRRTSHSSNEFEPPHKLHSFEDEGSEHKVTPDDDEVEEEVDSDDFTSASGSTVDSTDSTSSEEVEEVYSDRKKKSRRGMRGI